MKCPNCKKEVDFQYREDMVSEGYIVNDGGNIKFEEEDLSSADNLNFMEFWCPECSHSLSYDAIRKIFIDEELEM